MWPRQGRSGVFSFLQSRPRAVETAESEEPVQPSVRSSPVSPAPPPAQGPASVAPGPQAGTTPKPSPLPPTAAPAPKVPTQAEKDEEAADLQFKIAVGFLRREQRAQARQSLQELILRYSSTRVAAQARELMSQIPPDVAQAAPPVQRPVPAAAAPAAQPAPEPTLREKIEQGALTNDDLAARRGQPSGARKVVIPPSLQGPGSAPAQPVAIAGMDDVRVTAVTQEAAGLGLTIEYRLGSQRGRPVFVGAWVQVGTAARNFGYNRTPLTQGAGVTNVVLPGATRDVSTLRLAFFEEGGQRFFIKDINIQK